MARSMTAKGKIVRKFGTNIYGQDKYDRLLARRSNPPGQHGGRPGRSRTSNFGQQLKEKQKLKLTYGLLERQFRRTFDRAQQRPGVTGDNLLTLLELRLDNSVYRAGFAATRTQARQLVRHGHLLLNGRKADIPSLELRVGDRISVRNRPKSRTLVARLAGEQPLHRSANWIETGRDQLDFRLASLPEPTAVRGDINPQLIVEYYSR